MRAPGDTRFDQQPSQPKRRSECDVCKVSKEVKGPIYSTCDDCLRMKGYVRGKWGWYKPGFGGKKQ